MLKALRHFITDTPTAGLHLADMWLGHILFALGQCNRLACSFINSLSGDLRPHYENYGDSWTYLSDISRCLLKQYNVMKFVFDAIWIQVVHSKMKIPRLL